MYKLLALVFLLSLCSCASLDKLARKHPDQLAKICATTFPVRDSVGEPEVTETKKADNTDYSGAIDSVNREAEAILEKIKQAAAGTSDSLKRECLEVVTSYQADVKKLNTRLRALQANYRPCKPDTVYITRTVFRENTAKSASLGYALADKEKQLTLQTARADHWQAKAKRRFWILVFLLLLIAAYIAGKLKRIF